MKTIGRAFHDLRREIGWVLLYGVLTAIVLSSFIGSISGFRQNLTTARFLSGFKQNRVDMLILESKGSYRISKTDGQEAPTKAKQLDALFREALSKDGTLGGVAELSSAPSGFARTVLIVGRMADCMPVRVPNDRDLYLAVSSSHADRVGTSVKIGREELPIEATVPNGTMVGTLYNHTRSGDLDDALFVFAKDYSTAYKTFYCAPNDFLFRLIAVDADDAFKTELLESVSSAAGMHARLWSAQAYLRQTGDSGMQYLLLRIVFFGIASFALIAAMVMNLLRVLDAHTNDYAVHRLFGATKAQTFLRMLLLAIGFHIIPVAYIACRILLPPGWTGSEDGGALKRGIVAFSPEKASMMGNVFVVLLLLIAAVCVIGYVRFQRTYAKGMRRE